MQNDKEKEPSTLSEAIVDLASRRINRVADTKEYRSQKFKSILNVLEQDEFYNSLSEEKKAILEALLSVMIELQNLGSRITIHSSGCAAPAFERRLKTICKMRGIDDLNFEAPKLPNHSARPRVNEEKVRAIEIFKKKDADAQLNSGTHGVGFNFNMPQLSQRNDTQELVGTLCYSYTQNRKPVDNYDYTGQVNTWGCDKLQPLVDKAQEIYKLIRFDRIEEEAPSVVRSKL